MQVVTSDHQLNASITQPVLVSEQLIFKCNGILAVICRDICEETKRHEFMIHLSTTNRKTGHL